MSELDKNQFVEVNESKCGEVHNCTGTKEHEGKIYCRGCGNVQPENNRMSGKEAVEQLFRSTEI